MPKKDKAKGIVIIASGIALIIFVYNFDALMARPTEFGASSKLGFIIGVISVINGLRIYRRK